MENLFVFKCPDCGHTESFAWPESSFEYHEEGDYLCECERPYKKEDVVPIDEAQNPKVWLNWIASELEDANRHSFTDLPDNIFNTVKEYALMGLGDHVDEQVFLTGLAKEIALSIHGYC